jgi:hypothetical protein
VRLTKQQIRLGKLLGRIGSWIGFVGPVLFYAVPWTWESHFVCPQCPYVDVPFATRWSWLEIGLKEGLLQGAGICSFGIRNWLLNLQHQKSIETAKSNVALPSHF